MMSTETTYYPTNNAGYPNWPQRHNNMHDKGPNDSRVVWTFFFFFLSYGHHPIAPTAGGIRHICISTLFLFLFFTLLTTIYMYRLNPANCEHTVTLKKRPKQWYAYCCLGHRFFSFLFLLFLLFVNYLTCFFIRFGVFLQKTMNV